MQTDKQPLLTGNKVVIADYVFMVIKVTRSGNLMLRPLYKLPETKEITVVEQQ